MPQAHKRERRAIVPLAMTAHQLSECTGIPRRRIIKAIRMGELPSYRIGVRRLCVVTDILTWLKSFRGAGKPRDHETAQIVGRAILDEAVCEAATSQALGHGMAHGRRQP